MNLKNAVTEPLMDITITPLSYPITKTLKIPGSKSITNRALLLAALAQGTSTLSNVLNADDSMAFANALVALGISLTWDKKNNTCHIEGSNGHFPNTFAHVFCQDAGTAARFLLAACATQRGTFTFDGTPRLRQRPHDALIQALRQQGTAIDANHFPLTLSQQKKLLGGTIAISGENSSQYISALLMASPLAANPTTLVCEHLRQSYVKITCQMMREFGVNVLQKSINEFFIPNDKIYHARDYTIEPDLSTAAYFFAAAAITQSEITIPLLNRRHCLQGDIRFLEVLEKMGCKVIEKANAISLQGPEKLTGIEIDMNEFSDTFMTLSAIAPFATSPVIIHGLTHTQHQESNRVEAVLTNLKKLGIHCEGDAHHIKIYPGLPYHQVMLHSFADHRIAMAFSLVGLKIPGITIQHAECVSKTCPEYFSLLHFAEPQ
jgi:3-phosphoshikimate 1-carboxyvinyltransferase